MIAWLTLALVVHAVLLLAVAGCVLVTVLVLRGNLFPFDEPDQTLLPFDEHTSDGDGRQPAA